MKQNKYIVFSVSVILGSLALASFVFADEASPSPSISPSSSPGVRQDKKQEIKNKTQDRVQKAKEKADQEKAKAEEKKAKEQEKANQEKIKTTEKKAKEQEKTQRSLDNVRKFWGDMVKKLEELLKNEDRTASGLSDKLDKAALKSKDVTAFRKQLDDAKKLLADARIALKNAGSKVEDILKTETDMKVAKQKVMDLEKGIRDQVKAAHQALEEVRKTMKGLNKEESKPSTSPSPTPTPTP